MRTQNWAAFAMCDTSLHYDLCTLCISCKKLCLLSFDSQEFGIKFRQELRNSSVEFIFFFAGNSAWHDKLAKLL